MGCGHVCRSGTVTIKERVTVSGAVTLILLDGCDLTAEKGIGVIDDNSLTITSGSTTGTIANDGVGTGKLTARGTVVNIVKTGEIEFGDEYPYECDCAYFIGVSAGIGGVGLNPEVFEADSKSTKVDSGIVTINGGTVTAEGASCVVGDVVNVADADDSLSRGLFDDNDKKVELGSTGIGAGSGILKRGYYYWEEEDGYDDDNPPQLTSVGRKPMSLRRPILKKSKCAISPSTGAWSRL